MASATELITIHEPHREGEKKTYSIRDWYPSSLLHHNRTESHGFPGSPLELHTTLKGLTAVTMDWRASQRHSSAPLAHSGLKQLASVMPSTPSMPPKRHPGTLPAPPP